MLKSITNHEVNVVIPKIPFSMFFEFMSSRDIEENLSTEICPHCQQGAMIINIINNKIRRCTVCVGKWDDGKIITQPSLQCPLCKVYVVRQTKYEKKGILRCHSCYNLFTEENEKTQ